MKLKGRTAAAAASPRSSPRKGEAATSPRSTRRSAATEVNGAKTGRTPAKRQKVEHIKVEEAVEDEEEEMVDAPEEEVEQEEEVAEEAEEEYPEQEAEEAVEYEEGEEGVEEEAQEEAEGEEAQEEVEGEEVQGEEAQEGQGEADPSDTVYDWIDEETYVPKAEPNIMSYVRRHLFKGMIIYICKVCEKGFDSMTNLAKHIGRKHNDIPVKYVDGDYTDDGRPMGKKGRKRYRDSTGTPRNIKREKSAGTPGERQFPCPHCTHWAMTKEALRVHIYTHTGERHHVCNVCGNKFTQRASLNRHMATHTGEKRHKCPICEKRFIQKCSLDRHMDTHQGIKRYKCDVCGEQYSQSYPLSKHIKKKHPEYWVEFNEDRRYMPRNTPLQQRMTDKQVEMQSPIQLFNEPGEEQEQEEHGEEQGEEQQQQADGGIVVEMEEEQEVAPVISMPNASRMEKKKATVRKSMIQLKSAEDVMNLFEDVVVGPIEIAPIKGEGENQEEEEEEVEGEEGVEAEEEMMEAEPGEEQVVEATA